MDLFSKDDKMVADLCEFSRLFDNTIGGMDVEGPEDDKKEEWGTATTKYSHGYGRDLKYRETTFWAGLGINGNKPQGFIIEFKPGTFSPSQKHPITELLDDDKFKKFCKNKDIKILQNFILDTYKRRTENSSTGKS